MSAMYTNCGGCGKRIHPKFVTFCGVHYLCYECSKKHPPAKDPQDNFPSHNLVQLMMRREMGDCVREVDVNRVSIWADGMQIRHNLLKRPRSPGHKLLNKNEILMYNVPAILHEEQIEYARLLVNDLGIKEDAVLSAITIRLPEDRVREALPQNHYYHTILPFEPTPLWQRLKHLLIRLCPDWRNRRKPECDIGPNDIVLQGVPEPDTYPSKEPINCTINYLTKNSHPDKYLVRLVARNSGVYIEEDMFTVDRIRSTPSCVSPYVCCPELPRPLLVRFTSRAVRDSLASAFRKQNDLIERAPYNFAALRMERQVPSDNRNRCSCIEYEILKWKKIHTGGFIFYRSSFNYTNETAVVRISCDGTLSGLSAAAREAARPRTHPTPTYQYEFWCQGATTSISINEEFYSRYDSDYDSDDLYYRPRDRRRLRPRVPILQVQNVFNAATN